MGFTILFSLWNIDSRGFFPRLDDPIRRKEDPKGKGGKANQESMSVQQTQKARKG